MEPVERSEANIRGKSLEREEKKRKPFLAANPIIFHLFERKCGSYITSDNLKKKAMGRKTGHTSVARVSDPATKDGWLSIVTQQAQSVPFNFYFDTVHASVNHLLHHNHQLCHSYCLTGQELVATWMRLEKRKSGSSLSGRMYRHVPSRSWWAADDKADSLSRPFNCADEGTYPDWQLFQSNHQLIAPPGATSPKYTDSISSPPSPCLHWLMIITWLDRYYWPK